MSELDEDKKVRSYYIAFNSFPKNPTNANFHWRVTSTTNNLSTSQGIIDEIDLLAKEVGCNVHIHFIRELDG